ncbi:MAG: iron-sulfur cluster assembly scaffold protein [Planktomarina sp.]
MSDQTDLINLYSTQILGLAADIAHLGTLDAADGTALERSPRCGSQVRAYVNVANGQITDFAQDVKACALGQASAAIFGKEVMGKTQAELETAHEALSTMLSTDGPAPAAPFDGYEVLRPAVAFENRHASILLPLKAAINAMKAAAT